MGSVNDRQRYHRLKGHQILAMFTGRAQTSTPPTLAECASVLYQHNWFPKELEANTQANLIARRDMTRRLLHSGHCYKDERGRTYERVAVPDAHGQWGYPRKRRVSTKQQARRLNWKRALELAIGKSRLDEYKDFISRPNRVRKDLDAKLDHILADYYRFC